jgi:REP element-mobilizing transposase RayT
MNRGVARRTIFETRRDARLFLALLAKAVRRSQIEVHAFVLMTTHFHLLLRSLDGNLSETMRYAQNLFARHFNRTRERPGPLFQGRFRSIPVESSTYLHTLIRYIDQNPVTARLVARPEDHPYGSARWHAGPRRPPWLSGALVDAMIGVSGGRTDDRESAYRRTFAPPLVPAVRRLVGERILHHDRDAARLEDLIRAYDGDLRAWMVRNARSADGTRPGLPVVLGSTVRTVVHASLAARNLEGVDHPMEPELPAADGRALLAGLLRDLAGETYRVVARHCRIPEAGAWRLHQEHAQRLRSDPAYAARAEMLARRILAADPAGLVGHDPAVGRLVA